MRDPRRIAVIMGAIAQYWSANPDLRFFQLVDNLKYMLPQEAVTMQMQVVDQFQEQVTSTVNVRDAYHVEDDILLETLLLAMVEVSNA